MARTQALVEQYFQWPELATTLERYVRSCDACERNKVVCHAPFAQKNPKKPKKNVRTPIPPPYPYPALAERFARLNNRIAA